MNILWITWKDKGHPEAGGAEVVCFELCKRLIADGHTVTLLTTTYSGAAAEGPIPGLHVIRKGSSRYTHPFQALWHYIRHLRNRYDAVIEEINGGAPYFAVFFGRRKPRYLLYHQLARVNWLYEIPQPLAWIGYFVAVPLATRLLSLSRVPVITVSESTRAELAKFGLAPQRTRIISEGLSNEPLKTLASITKFTSPTVLSHGSMRAMKRTLDQIKAFELAKKQIPELQMKISGSSSGPYGQAVLRYIETSPYKDDIEYLGRTTDEQKLELMQKCHAILVTSVEEGWGLIISEANSQGTPAVVYDVAGLRDSVRHNETGLVTAENPAGLADGIVSLFKDTARYEALRRAAWTWSKTLTFDQSYKDLKAIMNL
jgi:glycosyltransferase involved in cell wall biosynthesis